MLATMSLGIRRHLLRSLIVIGVLAFQAPSAAQAQIPAPLPTAATLQIGCDKGNADDCSTLGKFYVQGASVERDYGKARALFQRACDAHSANGCNNLGNMYRAGLGVDKDSVRAAVLFKAACEGGSSVGCLSIARSTTDGDGVPKDDAKANGYYRRACDGGAPAGCTMAQAQSPAPVVPSNRATTTDGYEKSCDSAAICNLLGLDLQRKALEMLRDSLVNDIKTTAVAICNDLPGLGCNKSNVVPTLNKQGTPAEYAALMARAKAYFHKALAIKPDDQTALSTLKSIEADELRSLQQKEDAALSPPVRFQRQCDRGVADACIDLAELYDDGEGVPKDIARAQNLYLKACDAGEGSGCFILGLQNQSGKNSPVNGARAMVYFDKACVKGHAESCAEAGRNFASGNGVGKDPAKAADYLKKALVIDPDNRTALETIEGLKAVASQGRSSAVTAQLPIVLLQQDCNQGIAAACTSAALLYVSGKDVPQDLARAQSLLTSACAGNDGGGCGMLGLMNREGVGVPQNIPQAAKLFVKGCGLENAQSCVEAGKSYAGGAGVSKDSVQAMSYFKKALAIDPANESAKASLASLQQAH